MPGLTRLHRHKREGHSGQAYSVHEGDRWWVGMRSVERFSVGQPVDVEAPLRDGDEHLDVVGLARSDDATFALRAGRERRGGTRAVSVTVYPDGAPSRTLDFSERLQGLHYYVMSPFVHEGALHFIAGKAGDARFFAASFESEELRDVGPAHGVEFGQRFISHRENVVRLGDGVQMLDADFNVLCNVHASGPSALFLDGAKALACHGGNAQLWNLGETPVLHREFALHRNPFPSAAVADSQGRFFAFAHGSTFDVVSPEGDLLLSKQPRGKDIARLDVDDDGRLLVVTWKYTDLYEVNL